jgi:uncharacterized protein (DUF952 family)
MARVAVARLDRPTAMTTVYKICPARLWREAVAEGIFRGSGIDLADGYIHFSTADTVQETAGRHFAGAADLVLVAFDDLALGPELRYEPSRGGALFPHLYGTLDPAIALWARPLTLTDKGVHIFPDLAP